MTENEHTELVERDAPRSPFENNPRLPTDGGLSSLGLIMQLSAAVMVCYNLFLVVMALTPRLPDGLRTSLLLVALLGVVRSIVHYGAGSGLRASLQIPDRQ